jgi:hypothetical protein
MDNKILHYANQDQNMLISNQKVSPGNKFGYF